MSKEVTWPPKYKISREKLQEVLDTQDIDKISEVFTKHPHLDWTQEMLFDTIKKGIELSTQDRGASHLYALVEHQKDLPFTEEIIKYLFDNFWEKEFVYFYILSNLDKNKNPLSIKRKPTQREIFLLKQEEYVQINDEDLVNYVIPEWANTGAAK